MRVVAGGTDLWPNLKRRQEKARHRRQPDGDRRSSTGSLRRHRARDGELRIGATTTLDRVAASPLVRERYPALADAAAGISTVALRNMGTLGGNLCLNTRCTYFGQSEEWRCSIDYCMKEKGTVCWVAPSSDRCWAISASDAAPVLAALGARVRLVSAERRARDPGDRPLPRRRHRLVDQAPGRDPGRDPPPGRQRRRPLP